MFWVPLAMAAGGAVLGKAKHDRQQEIENRSRDSRAAEQKYSWATGRDSFSPIQYAGSQFGEMAGGALSGLGTGLSMGSAGMFDSTAAAQGATGANQYANALGGNDMASQLGAQGAGMESWYAQEMKKPQTLMGGAPQTYPQQSSYFGNSFKY